MPDVSQDALSRALVDVLRDALLDGEDVEVPGLGTFHVHHEMSRVREHPDGRIEMQPPRDVVAFAPEP